MATKAELEFPLERSSRKRYEGRILIFKGDLHTVDGQGVLLILVSVVVPRDVALHRGNVCYILHAIRRQGDIIMEIQQNGPNHLMLWINE